MNGVTIQVGGGNGKPLMEAVISRNGKSIDISHCDGQKSTIKVGRGEKIDMVFPSICAKVMFLQLTDGRSRLLDTRTGEPWKRRGKENPQFYT